MSAIVWQYFIKVGSSLNANNKAKCKKCGVLVTNNKGSTSAMNNHMRNIHDVSCKRKHEDSNASEEDPTKAKQKGIEGFLKKSTLAEIVSELATKDGFSVRGITRSNFIRQAFSDKGYKLPLSANGTMALIHSEFEKKKQQCITVFDTAKKKVINSA